MPIYEFQCKVCKKDFELLLFTGEKPECPYCKNKNITRKISSFNALGAGSAGSGKCNLCPPGKNCKTCR